MKLLSIIIVLMAFMLNQAWAQELKPIVSLPIKAQSVSLDLQNNLFIADWSGNISKYDSLGHLLSVYSPSRKTKEIQLEASLNLKIWAFYIDLQQIVLLDRQLRVLETISLPFDLPYIQSACLDNAQNIWIIDNSELSLKRWNLSKQSWQTTTRFDLILAQKKYDFRQISFYKNRIYISDATTGLLMFDNFGTYIRTVNRLNIHHFVMDNQAIITWEGSTITRMDLVGGEQEKLELKAKVVHLSTNATRMAIAYDQSVVVYKR